MNKPEFVYVTYINTTPEKLWEALTTTEFTKQYWFGTDIETTWKEGSPITLRNDYGTTIIGNVVRYDRPNTLAYTWGLPDSDEQPSHVTFTLNKQDDAVQLTVIHNQFATGSDMAEKVSKGWPAVLSSLKSLLENGKPINYMNWKKCG